MSYPVLDPAEPRAERAGVCALAVMAKAPRAGKVKTRLAPALGFAGSAAINVCFLRDTTRNIAKLYSTYDDKGLIDRAPRAAGLVCYTPVGDEAAFDGLLPEGFALIAQRGDAFGERLLAAAQDILACGYSAVCLIDSDSPTLPAVALRQAVDALAKPGDRVVLGGSDDGGYYLIGLKQAHAAPFERITWSTSSVYAETMERCAEAGLAVVELPTWYDVDDAATLAVLERELMHGQRPAFATVDGYDAQATREFLQGRAPVDPAHDDEAVMNGAPGGDGGCVHPLNTGVLRQRPKDDGEEQATAIVTTLRSLRAGRSWMTNITLCLLGLGLLLLTREYAWEYGGFGHYVLGGSGCSGWSVWLYLAAVIVVMTQPVNRATWWIVVGFAVGLRAMLVFAEPFSSSDIYRYVWDGIAQHAGINPYRYVPGDPALTFLRAPNQDIFDSINRRDYAHTIYPPVAQIVYWLVTFFSPTVTAMKAAMAGFECVAVGAMVWLLRAMGRRREEVLLYAWCPVVVWEIAGGGHVDAAVIAFVSLALLFRYREQPVWVGLFLGLAIFTKFYPAVLLPALWKRGDWKMPAVVAVIGAAGYAVYSSVGMGVFGFLSGYEKEEGIDSGVRFFLLDLAQHIPGLSKLPVGVFLVFSALVLGAVSVWAWRWATVESIAYPVHDDRTVMNGAPRVGSPRFMQAAMLLGLTMMLLFAPHYAWYIVWLVPFFVLVPNLPLLAYLMMFFYMFTTSLADGTVPKMFVLNEWLYGVVAAAVVAQMFLRQRSLRGWLCVE